MSHTVSTYHIYQDTPEGRKPFTYMVFGPYSNGEFDVEVHAEHVEYGSTDTYLFTESDLPRDTHICADMWDAMDAYFEGYYTTV